MTLRSSPLIMLLILVHAAGLTACSPSHRVTVLSPPAVDGTELAIRFVWNLPVIDVEIGGEPVRLIVDLGGHDTMTLQPDVVDRVAVVRRTWRRAFTFNAAGDLSIDREIVIPDLQIGALALKEIFGHQIKLDTPEGFAEQVDGYLGAAILSQFTMLVDYPDRIVLYPAGTMPPEIDTSTWIECPIDEDRRSWGTVGERKVRIGWDTGASHTVIDPGLVKRLGLESGPPPAGQSNSGGGGELVSLTITLGGHAFESIEMHHNELAGAGVEILLGHNFFAAHRVLFDFAAGVTLVER